MRYRSPDGQRRPRRGLALALVLLLAAQLALVAPTTGASAKTEIVDAKLPTARDGTAAVTLAGHVYIFGGDAGARTPQIVRYDPLADQTVVMGATLPTPRAGMSAVAANGVAYLFGGWDGSSYTNQVVRYDPPTDTTTVMGATLPGGRTYTSAIFDGTHAYIFGGGTPCSPCTTEQILRYDPATDTLDIMSATLPTRRYGTSAIWDGSYAYIFGGVTASTSTEHAQIVRYDPASDTTAVLPVTLPAPRYHSAAAYIDGRAFVIGGYPCTEWPHYCDTIVSFDPATGNVSTEDTRLNTGRYLTSAAVRGDHIYIVGGYDGARTDQILRYGPDAAPAPSNHAPVLDPVAGLGIITGETGTRHVHASDPDGDTITLTMTGLPTGATFSDHGDGTGTLTWHTTSGDDGTYTLTARADDGRLLTTRTFTVYVDDDPPPIVAPIADLSVIEGAHIQLDVAASDPAGQNITLGTSGLPTGATFADHGDGTGTIDWPTTFDDTGVYDITVHASDGTSSDHETFQITVIEFDHAPVFDPITPADALAGSPYTLNVSASDDDGDPITLTATQLPPGATLTDLGNGSGRIDWTPTIAQTGSHTFRLEASAAGATAASKFTLDVLPAYAYTLTSESFGFLKAKPGDVLALSGRLTNTGYHADTYTFTGHETAGRPQGWSISAPGPLSLQPGDSARVTLTVTVPSDGTYSRPRLSAESVGDPSLDRILTAIIEVPIHVDITLDDPRPTVAELSFINIKGTVTATWWDGTPVVGQSIRITNTPSAATVTSTHLATEESATTDATGAIRLDYSLDPAASLPGDHIIEASAKRGPRTDSDTLRYTVHIK